ncbi:MAG: hypothetical protein GEU95_24070 [Rhizobiales bacterium]|nr:hypothetical protein [Hyphomicrobiales bacterium]
MDRKAIVGAIVAAAFVGVILIGRIALSQLSGQEIGARAAAFSALVAAVALIGLAAGSGLLERTLGW